MSESVFYDFDDETPCSWCDGEGWTDCYDPFQCIREHTAGGLCVCGGCGGSGLAEDQVAW